MRTRRAKGLPHFARLILFDCQRRFHTLRTRRGMWLPNPIARSGHAVVAAGPDKSESQLAADPGSTNHLVRNDYLILTVFCLLLFGFSMWSDRPLSMHEAVLPQTARTMLADGDWLVPKRGNAPWLESPPLPQWLTVCLAAPFGRCDAVWIARIGPTLMATSVVLMVAWMAAHWFGRNRGLLSGCVMATTCEFTRYGWLAEDEIFLCALVTAVMALFVKLEFSPEQCSDDHRSLVRRFFGGRRLLVLAFFVVLGMTNLAKGLLFGTVVTIVPIVAFLLWNADMRRITRYVWLWGWIAFLAVALAWPWAVSVRYPDIWELWNFDLGGRLDGSYMRDPWWYYPVNLLWLLAPWTPLIPIGLYLTRHEALAERYSPQRFLWCWAFLVPLVLTIPAGKHHHYMLHGLAPWSILSTFGLVWLRDRFASWPRWCKHPLGGLLTLALPASVGLWLLQDRLPGPHSVTGTVIALSPLLGVWLTWGVFHRNAKLAGYTLFTALLLALCFGHWYAGAYVDSHRHDAAFLQQVKTHAGGQHPVYVNMEVGDLRSHLCLFYLDADTTVPLHNLSFLADERIEERELLLIDRYGRRSELARWGDWQTVLQSEKTGGKRRQDGRLTLFRFRYHPDSPRVAAAQTRISPMQAMYRADGPYLQPTPASHEEHEATPKGLDR